MIARLAGTVVSKRAGTLVVDVAGVGYQVAVPDRVLSQTPPEGGPVVLHVHTHYHERGIELYGFIDEEDRDVFRRLISVSGVGPKLALAALSVLEAPRLAAAVYDENISVLTQIPGVGKKTAKRLAMELKDHLSVYRDARSSAAAPQDGAGAGREGVVSERLVAVQSALVNMGYRQRDVGWVVAELEAGAASAEVEQLLVEALRLLARTSL